MSRIIVKPGQIPLDTDPLQSERFSHVALGRFAAAVMGIDSVVVDGLAVTQTSPASMQVNVSAGCLLVKGQVDPNDYGSLLADTRPLMRLGELAQDTLITLTAPGVFGQSINYLIQATFSETDDTALVRPYYNASNPAAPYSGPGGSGTTDYTVRRAACAVQAKAGAAAATGSQVTPSADVGYVPLAVVSVAYGATTISSVNITGVGTYPTAPYLVAKLPDIPDRVQQGLWIYATDTGSANALVVTLSPTPSVRPRLLIVKAGNANTDAVTINVNGLGAVAIKNADGTALQAGQIAAGALLLLGFDGTNYQLLSILALPPAVTLYWQNLPIYPEIQSSGNVLTFTTSTGQIVVNSGLTWLHRGWQAYASANLSSGNRTFTTSANKTYHLRWHAPGTGSATPAASYPSGRFLLQDLADNTYNPSSLAEYNKAFDTTYDDMLCAKVVTNGSNVLTVTPLLNKNRHAALFQRTNYGLLGNGYGLIQTDVYTINWARTPTIALRGFSTNPTTDYRDAQELTVNPQNNDRYTLTVYSYECSVGLGGNYAPIYDVNAFMN